MKRIDLRKSSDFFTDLKKHIDNIYDGEVLIVLFEIGDFSIVDKCFEFVNEHKCKMMNSLKFNQIDWMITIKKELR